MTKASPTAESRPAHTPGSWTCRSDDGRTFASTEDEYGDWSHSLDETDDVEVCPSSAAIAIRGGGHVLALVVAADPNPLADERPPELAANAYLMAAAPLLLAELQETAEWLDDKAKILRKHARACPHTVKGRELATYLRAEAARFEGRATRSRTTSSPT